MIKSCCFVVIYVWFISIMCFSISGKMLKYTSLHLTLALYRIFQENRSTRRWTSSCFFSFPSFSELLFVTAYHTNVRKSMRMCLKSIQNQIKLNQIKHIFEELTEKNPRCWYPYVYRFVKKGNTIRNNNGFEN